MLLNDAQIHERCTGDIRMIDPFVPSQIRHDAHGAPVISYGLSSCGYDIRLAGEFKICSNAKYPLIDPKQVKDELFIEHYGEYCIIPPHSFVLARSFEKFHIPRDILGVCFGKSTYARCGVIVNVTPLEPEWEGYLTIEISNTTPCAVKVYAHEGIAQVVFFKTSEACRTSYRDRNGKYQGQAAEPVLAKV